MGFVMNLRKSYQPLNKPSAGSVFKRINGQPVSKIIDELGFKGESVGGAKVSEKHAGFIVNCDNATAQDVKLLINKIKNRVYLEKGIRLEEEIKYIEN
jgi:UDP-N-acetylmuramate dehydrogenase